jgi:hypothetical protein
MSTTHVFHALEAILQDLQGAYATGQALVKSTAGTVSLPAGSFAVPIMDGSASDELTCKVEPNSATLDRSWPVTTDGAEVIFTTLQGGQRCRIPAGTRIKFDPWISGVSTHATVTGAGIVGGTNVRGDGKLDILRQVKLYKDLGERASAADFFRAQTYDFPAAVICWIQTSPGDGTTSPTMGVSTARAGRGKRFFVHEFEITLVGSRLDGANERRKELDRIRDDLILLLTDRVAWRDLECNLTLLSARATGTTATSYLDTIRVTSEFVLKRLERRTFNPWIKTRTQGARENSLGDSETDVDVTDEMDQG